ncbi:hypothetical protein NDU88_005684 [Pleurodeles waltl]|uniref:Uncharacterized protein n=1 Tax=Pleurodeles waltl TaxID=8319 RepID=A0AAV7L3R6_PLEWA|nr:hypothetical protein NDU88_005684 [Pleurodeles waltl]
MGPAGEPRPPRCTSAPLKVAAHSTLPKPRSRVRVKRCWHSEMADAALRESRNSHNNKNITTSINISPMGFDRGSEATRIVPMVATSRHLNRGQAASSSNNKRRTVAEIHRSAQLQPVESYNQQIFGYSQSCSIPVRGTKEVPQALLTAKEHGGWTLQETSVEAQGREDESRGASGEDVGEENSPKKGLGEVGRPD